jgi:hypothetical protein
VDRSRCGNQETRFSLGTAYLSEIVSPGQWQS